MSAPIAQFEASGNPDSTVLLDALSSLAATERRNHATVFNYWLSIRGNREFPPIRDLDPLQISDAGPHSLLLGIIDEGADADIRHIGAAIKAGVEAEKVSEVAAPSLLSCIAGNLPAVVASKQPYAFEDRFEGEQGPTRCWVSLLPFSASGSSVDYVYGYVSLAAVDDEADEVVEAEAAVEFEPADAPVEGPAEVEAEAAEPATAAGDEVDDEEELVLEDVVAVDDAADSADAVVEPNEAGSGDTVANPGFSGRLSEKLKAAAGFYGRVADLELGQWKVEAAEEEAAAEPGSEEDVEVDEPPVAEEPETVGEEPENLPEEASESFEEPEEVMEQPEQPEPEQPAQAAFPPEGGLQALLDSVREKTDEARQAKLRSNIALYEGLSAAYDFALDAEHEPEDYLRLVEAQGLKIKLRSPMAPVVRLAFDGMCDDSTISQLEAVLSWAFKQDLPRGSLAERIQAEGGIGAILDNLGSKS